MTFDISYDDGDSETRVAEDMIRLLDKGGGDSKKARIEEGSKVEANYRGKGKWYPGKITRDRGDKTFDISYDDGESETRVAEDMIRLLESALTSRSPARGRFESDPEAEVGEMSVGSVVRAR